ncbi:ATP-dependent Clp protease ATP-binding subunit ClpA [Aquimarina sp. MAR_2010_214]|uniref:ATP-dependent Clp protease ATP-binding subunit n=1 Tax=Aquimarina sp. MAR_2010_214 TaxID=1250026 RepID=UPI000C704416|nr:ATP-dependent Clp protease ATP-binding subunit [Aquimarina sp. MAR_2010_214]PKV50761.1 ATP-dependent Clp protease ATP-binding subunit ClpA [Aquimarina sp. MAR_2010_214]
MQTLEYLLSKEVKNTIHIAQSIAKEYHNNQYNAAHLLKALLHKDVGLKDFFNQIDGDIYYFEEWSEVRIEVLPRATNIPDKIEGDKTIEAIFNEADSIKLKLGEDEITPLSLLVSICTPGVGFSYEQLKTLPLKADDILIAANTGGTSSLKNKNSISKKNISNTANKVDSGILQEYCIDKTFEAKNKALKDISGRDAAIKMIMEILGRHSKPNVLITGDPGVGKSVLLDGFSETMINGTVPDALKNAQIYELDFIHLVSGASYKSEVEDRFKKIITALKEFEKPVLLIDEINNLTDKDNGNQGLVNILKSELVKGEITFIGTVTNDAFRKHIEIDEGLSRRFEIITLEEPSEEDALTMISDTIDKYKKHHNLDIDNDTIEEAIRLSKRFNKERSLPDSAIDLIDRTMSATRYMLETTVAKVENVKKDIEAIKSIEKEEDEKISDLKWQWENLKQIFSYLLFADLGDDDNFVGIEKTENGIKKIENVLEIFLNKASIKKETIDKNDISSTIANKTGIPVGKLQADEKERLLTMEDHLKKRVIGQDHAIQTITEAILESRSGLSKPGLPIGSFFFTGPTGTGKTELAKSLAEFLFQTEEAIIRFDMSEFKEEHSAALLYGAPPGYVGYEEGGLLVNKIRQKPYSIVLFDEIEKAHPSVFDIFLQILDEGKLNDRLGKTGDFSNAVILFTSNIGSEHVIKSFTAGEIPKSTDLLEIMSRHFRPEFLGRLTEIIPFSPITKNNVVKIFEIQMKDLYKALNKQEITLELTEKAKEFLAHKGFTPKYGARPLRGIIRTELRSSLSKKIITGKISKGSLVQLDVKEEKLIWNYS